MHVGRTVVLINYKKDPCTPRFQIPYWDAIFKAVLVRSLPCFLTALPFLIYTDIMEQNSIFRLINFTAAVCVSTSDRWSLNFTLTGLDLQNVFQRPSYHIPGIWLGMFAASVLANSFFFVWFAFGHSSLSINSIYLDLVILQFFKTRLWYCYSLIFTPSR